MLHIPPGMPSTAHGINIDDQLAKQSSLYPHNKIYTAPSTVYKSTTPSARKKHHNSDGYNSTTNNNNNHNASQSLAPSVNWSRQENNTSATYSNNGTDELASWRSEFDHEHEYANMHGLGLGQSLSYSQTEAEYWPVELPDHQHQDALQSPIHQTQQSQLQPQLQSQTQSHQHNHSSQQRQPQESQSQQYNQQNTNEVDMNQSNDYLQSNQFPSSFRPESSESATDLTWLDYATFHGLDGTDTNASPHNITPMHAAERLDGYMSNDIVQRESTPIAAPHQTVDSSDSTNNLLHLRPHIKHFNSDPQFSFTTATTSSPAYETLKPSNFIYDTNFPSWLHDHVAQSENTLDGAVLNSDQSAFVYEDHLPQQQQQHSNTIYNPILLGQLSNHDQTSVQDTHHLSKQLSPPLLTTSPYQRTVPSQNLNIHKSHSTSCLQDNAPSTPQSTSITSSPSPALFSPSFEIALDSTQTSAFEYPSSTESQQHQNIHQPQPLTQNYAALLESGNMAKPSTGFTRTRVDNAALARSYRGTKSPLRMDTVRQAGRTHTRTPSAPSLMHVGGPLSPSSLLTSRSRRSFNPHHSRVSSASTESMTKTFSSPNISDMGLTEGSLSSSGYLDDDISLLQWKKEALHAPLKLSLTSIVEYYLSLADPMTAGERRVQMYTAKLAQKSYGTERRFFCPSPIIRLYGASWFTSNPSFTSLHPRSYPMSPYLSSHQHHNQPFTLPHQRSYSSMGHAGIPLGNQIVFNIAVGEGLPVHTFDQNKAVCVSYDPQGHEQVNDIMSNTASAKYTFRNIYMQEKKRDTDTPVSRKMEDKKKHVTLTYTIDLAGPSMQKPLTLGPFGSTELSVISKPSTRKTVSKSEFVVTHGSTVALFNRPRTQTGNTRFLTVTALNMTDVHVPHLRATSIMQPADFLSTHQSFWDPFIIWIVSPELLDGNFAKITFGKEGPDAPNFAVEPRTLAAARKECKHIFYNQMVVLQCATTGCLSPVLVVRKIENGNKATGKGWDASGFYEDPFAGYGEDEPITCMTKVAFHLRDPVKMDATRTSEKGSAYLTSFEQTIDWRLSNGSRELRRDSPPSESISKRGSLMSQGSNSMPTLPSAAFQWPVMTPNPQQENTSVPVFEDESSRAPHLRHVQSDANLQGSFVSKGNSKVDPSVWATTGGRPSNRKRPLVQQMTWPKLDGHALPMASISYDSHLLQSPPAVAKEREADSLRDGVSSWSEELPESSIWTIVTTDLQSYTFWLHPDCTSTAMPSVPQAYTVSCPEQFVVELQGYNLNASYSLHLGNSAAELIDSVVRDDRSHVMRYRVPRNVEKQSPILLVHQDGIVINTGHRWPMLGGSQ